MLNLKEAYPSVQELSQERASLGEKTIVGLHVLKDAVRFFDPVSSQPERIPITQDLK